MKKITANIFQPPQEGSLEEQLQFPGLLPNLSTIRLKDFPLFDKLGRVYLDSGATSQEPLSVIEQMHDYRLSHIRGSNHSKNSVEARTAQEEYESAKAKIQSFFHAENYLVGLTSGTTDSSNWIATRFPFEKGDLLILTDMEHNSQILTARNFAKKAGADVKFIPINLPEGHLDLDVLEKKIKQTNGKIILNLVHASNVSGIINPVKKIREMIGNRGFIYLDMAQTAGHIPINLDELDVDFAGASSHKMYGPMGIGAIFINKKSERYIPNQISGGSAIKLVSRHFTANAAAPARFEPGTQDLEGLIEWGFAIDYLSRIGMDKIEKHDTEIGKYCLAELSKIPEVRILGPKTYQDKVSVIAFNIGTFLRKNYNVVATELDKRGISVRDGCFCAHINTAQLVGLSETLHESRTLALKLGLTDEMLKLPGSVRASFAFYNSPTDVYKLVTAVDELIHNKDVMGFYT